MVALHLLLCLILINAVEIQSNANIPLPFDFDVAFEEGWFGVNEMLIIRGTVNEKLLEFMISLLQESAKALQLVFAFDKKEMFLSSTSVSRLFCLYFQLEHCKIPHFS
jgi:hypothetical protein